MQEKKLRMRRGKFWIKAYPPDFIGGEDKPLAKILFRDPEELINRVVLVKASTITGRFQDRALNLFFRIVRVEPKGAFTSLIGAELGREDVSSKVRRRTSKVEVMGRRYKTKKDTTVKINLFAVTAHRCDRQDEQAIRKFFEEFLTEKVGNAESHEKFIYDLAVERKWNQEMKKQASRLYPIRDLVIEKVRAEDFLVSPRKIEEAVKDSERILNNAEKFS